MLHEFDHLSQNRRLSSFPGASLVGAPITTTTNQTRGRGSDRALEAVQYLLWFAATEMGFDNSSTLPHGDDDIDDIKDDMESDDADVDDPLRM